MNTGLILAGAGLVLGAASDYVRDKQMKQAVKEEVAAQKDDIRSMVRSEIENEFQKRLEDAYKEYDEFD